MGNDTPVRAFRIDNDLWRAALRASRRSGITLSDVVRKALREFVAEHGEEAGDQEP